ncbi:GNAT N-acetyltransferase [Colletotrichum tofieldiae]|uniref:GNAT N-acetyltransferase n=1 Tax=Colletotrichum tofieldiae TaxID=708197 RepID=A0A161Y5W9_9PEZI|nr:GNAT N-acetyltransferase [Colletotrichum tofieldiae]GKT64648.1 GNAT N-acetyltransferase [Colletotrichum tofieldiae]GKT74621.1 GNAT N-acetyltransferase [Colletotrichum tofieldiae]GKT91810.1 GNAT N-acetyltransferase [Colletotrichum tofieldiae]
MDVHPLDFVTVKTTLPTIPLLPHASRQPIVTERLILRPLSPDDLQPLHVLRTQPEVMKWSAVGRVDADMEETRTKLAQNLPPNDADNYDFAICLRSTGEWIGLGGCKKPSGGELGWPEMGYMLQKDYWGNGYATEFVNAFLGAWWSLPRSEREVNVDKSTVRGHRDGDVVEEIITAVTEPDNVASQKILGKWGFEKLKVWKEPGEEGGKETILVGHGIGRPKQ